VFTGEEPVVEGGACVAYVEVSGGRGSKADANIICHVLNRLAEVKAVSSF
jgi:hypothetical protein